MHFFHKSKFTSVENVRFSLHLSFIQLGITSNFKLTPSKFQRLGVLNAIPKTLSKRE